MGADWFNTVQTMTDWGIYHIPTVIQKALQLRNGQ